MHTVVRLYSLTLLCLMLLVSCSGSTQQDSPPLHNIEVQVSLQQVQETLQQARESVAILERLQLHERYPDDVQEARRELHQAETLFQQNALNEAYAAAQKSLTVSQQLSRQFYQQVIAQSAQNTKIEIEKMAEQDPDNPLEEAVSELNDILAYSDEIDQTQAQIDLERVVADLERIKQIERNVQTNASKILEADVSFESGRYELSQPAKDLLNQWSEDIIANVQRFQEHFPEKQVVLKLTVIGYTDQVDFVKGSKLVEVLMESADQDIPTTQPERRRFLNQQLSEFRARTISHYLVQQIEPGTPDSLQIEQEIIGRGETIPPELEAPYELSDPRRRICKIYTYLSIR
ncbi:OmpA family protein [candidate division KSB3 bacterium]|uniref:OmpA family protein n=1 Tax=candidate division KSB3 bacterium TaxID=2044937 RepID=A0A9D5Q3X9_9BACT|nr:OmpA family protein [candidate division KSB3 bacterium]MBD3323129.1 OmpA family protein [candidate division KSB3 bacterium]